MSAEALHARLAGVLEHVFNPILVKELRGSMRGGRFFLAHMGVLVVFALALLSTLGLLMAQAGLGDSGDPSEVGRRVFLVTQLLHLGVVFLVVPGLAATSITVERESLTHDLLVTTSLGARSIVWGKFSAALFQTFTLFISMLPLVGLTFLFGGVTVYQILANYAFLLGLSALMIAFSLFVSAHAATTQRAVGAVYGLALLAAGFGVLAAAAIANGRQDLAEAAALAYGFVSPGAWGMFKGSASAFERIFYVHVVPGYGAAALFGLFFLGAVNRLKPIFANRSTNLRVYAFAALAGLLAILVTAVRHELPEDGSVRERAEGLIGTALGGLVVALVAALFACDDGPVAPHLGRRWSGWRAILRPGCDAGAAFGALLSVLVAGTLFAGLRPLTAKFDRGAWAGLPAIFPWALACLAVATWGGVCALAGRCLSWIFPARPVLIRFLLIGGAVFLAVAPVVHWAVAQEIDHDGTDRQRVQGPATLLLSPVAAVLSAMDLSSPRREFPLLALGIPIPAGHSVVSVLLALVFLGLGRRAKRQEQGAQNLPPKGVRGEMPS